MKKVLFLSALLAAGLSSCSQSDTLDGPANAGETTITVSAAIPAEAYGTRAAGEGTEVNRCIMEIYLDGALYDERQTATVTNGAAQFEARLIAGQTYDFVFWADAVENDADVHYDTSELTNVFIKDAAAYKGNDDTRDAFFGKETVEVTATTAVSAKLKRPFGQLNIKASDMKKVVAANNADLVPTHVSIAFKAVPTGINLLTGELTEATEAVTYSEKAAVIDNEGTMSMDYIFAPKGEEQYLADFTMSFINAADGEAAADYEFSNIPVQRNYRTNVTGNLLTKKTSIDVEVTPDFGGDTDLDVEKLWDGSVATPETDASAKTITINSAAELAGLAEMINGGNNLAGYTVTLTEDVDLAGLEWTPIGGSGHPFNGTFEGGNHTISNLKISSGDYVGLFGSTSGGKLQNLTIDGANIAGGSRLGALVGCLYTSDAENITVKNVVLEGNHYLGGITGYSYGGLVNCTVEGVKATCTPAMPAGSSSYDDGDKVGGIVGWFASDDIVNCSVSNAELKGYRDIGGIAGYVGKDGADPKITGNKVSVATITADQQTNSYGSKDANAGEIVGRLATTSITYADNVYNDVTLNYIGCTSGVSVTTAAAAQSAIKTGGTVIVAGQIDKIDLTASAPLRPVTILLNEPVGEIVLGTQSANPEKTTIVVAKDVAYPAFSVVSGYDIKNVEIKGDPESNTGCSGLDVRNQSVAAVENLTFDGVRFDGQGVDLGYTANPQVTKNVVFENCVGVDMVDWLLVVGHNNYAGTEVRDFTIRNCKLSFSPSVGSNISGVYMTFMTGGTTLIENCEITNAGKHGLIFGDFAGEVIVRNNTITDCVEDGVKADNVKGSMTVEGNTIRAKEYGVRIARFLSSETPTINIIGNNFDMTSVKDPSTFNAISLAGSSSAAASAVLVVENNKKVAGNVDVWYSINSSMLTPAAGSNTAAPFAQ